MLLFLVVDKKTISQTFNIEFSCFSDFLKDRLSFFYLRAATVKFLVWPGAATEVSFPLGTLKLLPNA